jgi:SAM-dependent methyltransferase
VSAVADAYARGATAWSEGPARIYGPLAEALVAFSPQPLDGCRVLDLGSGTGVGSRAAGAVGARVVASDLVYEMLRVDRENRPPAAVSDALSLPFRDDAFDVSLACFALNHFDDPAVAAREAGRVARLVLASTYAEDDHHPVKSAVDAAMREVGWEPPAWYSRLHGAMEMWGNVERATDAVERGGLRPLRVERLEVAFEHLTVDDLVAWRLGMAHIAPTFDLLDERHQADVHSQAVAFLGPKPEALVRTVIFLAAAR